MPPGLVKPPQYISQWAITPDKRWCLIHHTVIMWNCGLLCSHVFAALRMGKAMRWWMAECLIWLLLLSLFPLWAKKNSGEAPNLWAAQCSSDVLGSAFSWRIVMFYKPTLTCDFVSEAGNRRCRLSFLWNLKIWDVSPWFGSLETWITQSTVIAL